MLAAARADVLFFAIHNLLSRKLHPSWRLTSAIVSSTCLTTISTLAQRNVLGSCIHVSVSQAAVHLFVSTEEFVVISLPLSQRRKFNHLAHPSLV